MRPTQTLTAVVALTIMAGAANAVTFTGADFRPTEGYIQPSTEADVDGQTARVIGLTGLACFDKSPALGGVGVDTPGGSPCGDNMCGPEGQLWLFGGNVLAEYALNGDHVAFTGTSIVRRLGVFDGLTSYYVSTAPGSQGYVASVTTSPSAIAYALRELGAPSRITVELIERPTHRHRGGADTRKETA